MTRLLLSLILAFSLAACSPVADTKLAEEGVDSFHRSMAAGQYAAIYDGSANDVKSAITRDDFVKMFAGLHSRLGPYKTGKTVGWNDNVGTGGHMVTLTRQAEFERGPGKEEFAFRIQDGRAILAGYHVTSNLLN